MISIDKSFRWVSEKYFDSVFARLFFILSIGVIVAEYTTFETNVFFVSIVVGLLFMIFSTFRVNILGKWIFIFSWSLFLFGSGGWLLRRTQLPDLADASLLPHTYIVELNTPPLIQGDYYRAEAEIIHTSDSTVTHLIGQTILLNQSSDSFAPTPSLCDKYLIHTRISRPDDYGLGGFDYGKYLTRHGLCGVAYLYPNNFKYLSSGQPSNLRAHTYAFRSQLIERFQMVGIADTQLAILSAITLGDKGLLSTDVKDSFSAAGVSHILVVSGMHVGFIFAVILLLFKRISSERRWLIVLLGLLTLWAYALLSGLAPSVVRATFMFSMILLFRVLGEKYRVEHALAFSATILILLNPNTLFDVGFQLSYLAVFGIVYLYPKLHKLTLSVKSSPIRWLLQSVAVTISAQLFTFPIVIYNFNQFPLYFVVSNLFVALFAPIIFLGGILLLPLSFVPYLGSFAGIIINFVVGIFSQIITLITSIPYATTNVYISLFELVLLYIIVFCGINWIELRNIFALRFKAPLYFLLSLLLFAVSVTLADYYYSRRNVLIIPETNRLIVNIFSDNENILFTNQPDFAQRQLERTWLKFSAPQPTVVSDTTLVHNAFTFGSEEYLILRDNVFRYLQNNSAPLSIDCLIIERGVYPSERLLTEFIKPKRVVLTSGVWHGYLEKYKQLLNDLSISYHIIPEDGAIITMK